MHDDSSNDGSFFVPFDCIQVVVLCLLEIGRSRCFNLNARRRFFGCPVGRCETTLLRADTGVSSRCINPCTLVKMRLASPLRGGEQRPFEVPHHSIYDA